MDWNFLTTLQFDPLDLDARDREILDALAQKLQDNYPYAAPEYAGQMIKPSAPFGPSGALDDEFHQSKQPCP